MRGSLLTEAVVALLLVSILLVFGFESISLSLTQTSRIESKIQATALLNFVNGYLSKYEIGNDLSDVTAQSINDLYWNGNVQYPRVHSLNFEIIQKTVSSKTIKYRKAIVKIEQRPGQIEEYTLVFGL